MSNMFAARPQVEQADVRQNPAPTLRTPMTHARVIDYSVSPSGLFDHVLAFVFGFVIGFGVLFIFFQILPVAIAGGAIYGTVNIFVSAHNAIINRKKRLRTQFFDLLEAMSVAMRAGSPPLRALESAREDLLLLYTATSDIIIEIDLIIRKFNNAVPLSDCFDDLAKRSKLDDIVSFASVYSTIEGKSSRADEIVRETQQIIADKMEIEMEIETMLTSAKSEINIMQLMPLLVLFVVSTAGAGFMDALFTTNVGRMVSAGGLVVFIGCYLMARAFSNIKI